jgi:hypothetical protein
MSDPKRQALPAAKLYAMLAEAFEKARDPQCRRCAMPLPVFRSPADSYAANWHTGVPRYCPFRCHLVIGEVQALLWIRYDMQPFETGQPAPANSVASARDDAAQS